MSHDGRTHWPRYHLSDASKLIHGQGSVVYFEDGRSAQCAAAGLWGNHLGYEAGSPGRPSWESGPPAHLAQAASAAVSDISPINVGHIAFTQSRQAAHRLALDRIRSHHIRMGDRDRSIAVSLTRNRQFATDRPSGDSGSATSDELTLSAAIDGTPIELSDLLKLGPSISAVVVETSGPYGLPVDTGPTPVIVKELLEAGCLLVAEDLSGDFARQADPGWPLRARPIAWIVSHGLTNAVDQTSAVVLSPTLDTASHDNSESDPVLGAASYRAVTSTLRSLTDKRFRSQSRESGDLLARGLHAIAESSGVDHIHAPWVHRLTVPYGRRHGGGDRPEDRAETLRKRGIWLPVLSDGSLLVVPPCSSSSADVARLVDSLEQAIGDLT